MDELKSDAMLRQHARHTTRRTVMGAAGQRAGAGRRGRQRRQQEGQTAEEAAAQGAAYPVDPPDVVDH